MQNLGVAIQKGHSDAGECKRNGDIVFETLRKELELWIAERLGRAECSSAPGVRPTGLDNPINPTAPHANTIPRRVVMKMEDNAFNDLPLLLAVPRAAQLLGISRAAAYRLAASGDLPVRRLGGRVYVVTAGLRELAS